MSAVGVSGAPDAPAAGSQRRAPGEGPLTPPAPPQQQQRKSWAELLSQQQQKKNPAAAQSRSGDATSSSTAAEPTAAGASSRRPAARSSGPARELEARAMAQAKKSRWDAAADNVKCRACGKPFTSYRFLAQHLHAKHRGINSDDAKFAALREASGAATADGGSSAAIARSSNGASRRAASGVSFSELFNLLPNGGVDGKSSGRVVSSSMRLGVRPRAASKSTVGARAAQRQLLLAPRPRLQRMDASGAIVPRKRRVTHLKRLILREKADKTATKAAAAVDVAQQAFADLQGELTKLEARLQQLGGCGTSGSGGSSGGSTAAPAAAAAAPRTAAAASGSGRFADVDSAVVELALQNARVRLEKAQLLLQRRQHDYEQAVAATAPQQQQQPVEPTAAVEPASSSVPQAKAAPASVPAPAVSAAAGSGIAAPPPPALAAVAEASSSDDDSEWEELSSDDDVPGMSNFRADLFGRAAKQAMPQLSSALKAAFRDVSKATAKARASKAVSQPSTPATSRAAAPFSATAAACVSSTDSNTDGSSALLAVGGLSSEGSLAVAVPSTAAAPLPALSTSDARVPSPLPTVAARMVAGPLSLSQLGDAAPAADGSATTSARSSDEVYPNAATAASWLGAGLRFAAQAREQEQLQQQPPATASASVSSSMRALGSPNGSSLDGSISPTPATSFPTLPAAPAAVSAVSQRAVAPAAAAAVTMPPATAGLLQAHGVLDARTLSTAHPPFFSNGLAATVPTSTAPVAPSTGLLADIAMFSPAAVAAAAAPLPSAQPAPAVAAYSPRYGDLYQQLAELQLAQQAGSGSGGWVPTTAELPMSSGLPQHWQQHGGAAAPQLYPPQPAARGPQPYSGLHGFNGQQQQHITQFEQQQQQQQQQYPSAYYGGAHGYPAAAHSPSISLLQQAGGVGYSQQQLLSRDIGHMQQYLGYAAGALEHAAAASALVDDLAAAYAGQRYGLPNVGNHLPHPQYHPSYGHRSNHPHNPFGPNLDLNPFSLELQGIVLPSAGAARGGGNLRAQHPLHLHDAGAPAGGFEYYCSTCNVPCNSMMTLQQHIGSRRHLQRAAQKAAAPVAAAAERLQSVVDAAGGASAAATTYIGPNADVGDYCEQEISAELNQAVGSLLLHLKTVQERTLAKNQIKTANKRFYVCGLREVHKSVRMGRALSVILAPNIEEIEAEGGLNDHVRAIIDLCQQGNTPVVFALSRKKLGEIYGFRKRMSAIAVLDLGGAEECHADMVQLAAVGRAQWLATHPEAAAAAGAAVGAARTTAETVGGAVKGPDGKIAVGGERGGSATGLLPAASRPSSS